MSTKTLCLAHIPYLNSFPFYHGLSLPERFGLSEINPREAAKGMESGEIIAAPIPLVAYLRNQDKYDRLGHFGIASRGRAHSTILFSRRPVKQMDGALIGVSDATTTTVCLLRLILEHRYKLVPARYQRGDKPEDPNLDALLLIGDDALRFAQTNKLYPFEVDVAFEWWLWQHLPCVFAVWAVRKDVPADDRKRLEAAVARALSQNQPAFDALAQDVAPKYGMRPEDVSAYWSGFSYRFGKLEEAGLEKQKALWEETGLLTWEP